jgi:hypothetical protein
VSLKPGDVYSFEEKWTAPDTGARTFTGPKVPQGKVVRIDHMAICDVTTVNHAFRLGYDRAGTQHWLKAGNAGASGFNLTLDTPLLLSEGEAPIAYSSSHAVGDEIHVVARGIYL